MGLLVGTELLEYKIGGVHLLWSFGADADAYAAVVLADSFADGFNSVVPCTAAADTGADLAEWDVELVVDYHDAVGVDFVEVGGGLDSLATKVHEGGWLDNNNLGVAKLSLGKVALEVFFLDPVVKALVFSETVNGLEADVVARAVVFFADVAKTHD